MEKTAIDYSKDTERYSQWRVLKAQQVGEYLKLAMPALTKNAPKARYKSGERVRKNTVHLIIAVIVCVILSLFVALIGFPYEGIVTALVAWIVPLCLLGNRARIYFKEEAPRKKAYKKEKKELYATLAALDPTAIKQQFAQLGLQADAIAVELGVDPRALAELHPIESGKISDDINKYREAVENISKEYDLVYKAYLKDRPDPFIDCGFATSPQGAKQKREDFMGFANAIDRIEGRDGYGGCAFMQYDDPVHADFLRHHKELDAIK